MIKLDIKSILLTTALPLITLVSPEAGKALSDANAALADGKLSEDEVKTLLIDAIDTAKKLWPQGVDELECLQVNIEVDVPNIEKTFAAFKALQPAKTA
jgi:hypothetical protein